jgi:hypothetical protein
MTPLPRFLSRWLIMLLGAVLFMGLTRHGLAQEIVRPPDPPHPISERGADPKAKASLGLDQRSPYSPNSTIQRSWEGMFQVGTIRPPDPHGAAGPSGIIATVNLRIAYYNKTGVLQWGPVTLSGASGFWGGVGNTGSGNSDPRALYDPASGRFFVIMQEATTANQSFLNLAVSKNSNPTTSGTADWYFYRLNNTEVVGATNYGADYPGLGIDSQAVYVTYNMYSLPFSTGVFKNCQIITLKKADIIVGTGTFSLIYTPDGSSSAFTLQPATVMGTVKPGNVAYFGEAAFINTTTVRVWALSDPLGTPSLTSFDLTVPDHGGSSGVTGAPQLGTATTVPTLTPRTQGNAFWYNGAMWFCHTAGGGSGKSSAYYYKVNTNNFLASPTADPTLAESGFIDGGAGVWTYQPSIGANANGDVGLVYTQSSSTQYPTIMYTTRASAGTSFDTPATLKASPGFSNSDRWGDYASVVPDPTDNTFWVTHEWARSSASHDWSTWWGKISRSDVVALQYTSTAISGGNGNGTIDFNECNDLTITLSNLGALGATSINATLSTTTSGVTVAQPTSAYPNIAGGGSGVNTTAFQISTSAGFVCGTPILLTLSVTYTGGSDSYEFSLPTCVCASATGSLIGTDLQQTGRLNRGGVAATCAAPTSCLVNTTVGSRAYDAHPYTNSSGTTICVTATITTTCGTNAYAVAYSGSFSPTSLCTNYLAEVGSSSTNMSMAFNVASGATFVIVIHEVNSSAGCASYTLSLAGQTCGTDGGGPCVIVPIQLASFTGRSLNANATLLEWTTASEVNNFGFEMQKAAFQQGPFATIPGSFVPGHGTTLEPQHYQYTDEAATTTERFYRLKQIDLSGAIHYHDPIYVSNPTSVEEKNVPATFSLEQNYPNPFNPSTIIKYALPTNTHVRLEVFNMVGQRVALLVDDVREAGYHQATFDGSSIASGVYIYKITAGKYVSSRKLALIK